MYIVVLRTTYEHCPLKRLIGNNTPCESCASFFIKLTTLNDGNIDKGLLLAKFVPSNTWPCLPNFFDCCLQEIRGTGSIGHNVNIRIIIRVRPLHY